MSRLHICMMPPQSFPWSFQIPEASPFDALKHGFCTVSHGMSPACMFSVKKCPYRGHRERVLKPNIASCVLTGFGSEVHARGCKAAASFCSHHAGIEALPPNWRAFCLFQLRRGKKDARRGQMQHNLIEPPFAPAEG